MAEDALEIIALRNAFYRDGRRKLVLGLLITVLMNVMMAFLLFYIISHPPAPRYFATSLGGRITPLFPLDRPNQADASILQWANKAAIAAFSYSYVNYRDELQASSGFFTAEGWTQFLTALKESNNLEAVKTRKMIVSAEATRAPEIIERGVMPDGRYSWRVQISLLVSYQGQVEASQNVIVNMLIVRVPSLNAPSGIGIAQFVVKPAQGES
jgi:intracellular multiplication protein IcmL